MPAAATRNRAAVDAAELADRLRPILLKLGRHLRRETQKLGISPLDAQLLAVIKARPGAGVSELADIEQMSRPAMSMHVKRLEAAGWLERGVEPGSDRRRTRILLSGAGRAALEAVRRSRTDWLEARLAALEPAELAVLAAALPPLGLLVEKA
ncbi:MAG: MarR family transcriptional regulator [Sphingomonadaceae bacterium]|nr:MarR family transcriptional regulator [Sphingomonadaceae bacterium]